jgi:RNA polymerase sigma-70 factor (ECF subfamily)
MPESEEFFAQRMTDESVFVDKMIEKLDATVLREAVASLSEGHRKMLLLRYFEDFSVAEIAGILEIPEGTVMSRLYNARKALKKILEKFYSINEGG